MSLKLLFTQLDNKAKRQAAFLRDGFYKRWDAMRKLLNTELTEEQYNSGSGLLVILMTLIQFAPIKINPWSALAKTIGKAINADMSSRLSEIGAKLDEHIKTDDRRTADNCRAQILHFNNELLRPIYHTKEEFVEVLAKIDDYERYCEEHPEYPNNRAVLAIENIREVYKERLKKRDFLQESQPRMDEDFPRS